MSNGQDLLILHLLILLYLRTAENYLNFSKWYENVNSMSTYLREENFSNTLGLTVVSKVPVSSDKTLYTNVTIMN